MTVKQMINVIRRNRLSEMNNLIQKMNEEIENEVPLMKEELLNFLQRSVKEGDVSYIPSLTKRTISVGKATEEEKKYVLKYARKLCSKHNDCNFNIYPQYERVKSYWMDIVVEIDTRSPIRRFLDYIYDVIGFTGSKEEA